MRIVRFLANNRQSFGVLVNESEVLDLPLSAYKLSGSSGRWETLSLNWLSDSDTLRFLQAGDEALKAAAEIVDYFRSDPQDSAFEGGLLRLGELKLLAPVARPGSMICLGLNYADHAAEQGLAPPEKPLLFAKLSTSVIGPDDAIVLPKVSEQVDYEVELAVVIGKRAKFVSESEAYDYVAGYTICNDVSARDLQFSDGQWMRGKSCDTFAPLGPYLVTKDDVPDPHALRISLTLNGETMQDSTTGQMIFKVPYIVSYISQAITLEPGDIISTGTPPGVGVFRKPPVFLKPGDKIEATVERIGTLRNHVVAV